MKSLLVLACLFLALPRLAFAQEVSCLVSDLDGEVALKAGPAKRLGLSRFSKLLEGDRLELAAGASVKLKYLAQGAVELWKGPAVLAIGPRGAQDLSGRQRPQVGKLGPAVMALKPSKLLSEQNELRGGGVNIRDMAGRRLEDAILDQAGLKELLAAQQAYAQARAQSPGEDMSPDIEFIGALDRLGQHASLAEHLAKLLKAQPGNAHLKAMLGELYGRP